MRTPLPSRASAPTHCRECDGPLLLTDDTMCETCTAAPVWQRIEWRYQNDEGITPLWDGERWTVQREFHPMQWCFSIEVRFGSEPHLTLSIGPWSLFAGRVQ